MKKEIKEGTKVFRNGKTYVTKKDLNGQIFLSCLKNEKQCHTERKYLNFLVNYAIRLVFAEDYSVAGQDNTLLSEEIVSREGFLSYHELTRQLYLFILKNQSNHRRFLPLEFEDDGQETENDIKGKKPNSAYYIKEVHLFVCNMQNCECMAELEVLDYDIQEERIRRVVRYFLNSVKNPGDNLMFLFVLALFYCFSDNDNESDERSLCYILGEVPMLSNSLSESYMKYFDDFSSNKYLIVKRLMIFVKDIVVEKNNKINIATATDINYYKMRLFFRELLNSTTTHEWLRSCMTHEFIDRNPINTENAQSLLMFPWVDTYGIKKTFRDLQNFLITNEKDATIRKGRSNNSVKTLNLKVSRNEMFKLFCQLFFENENKYSSYRPSAVLGEFRKLQKNLFGHEKITMKEDKYKFRKSSVAYNCNMMMIMTFCIYAKRGNEPGHDIWLNQICRKTLHYFSLIHKYCFSRQFNDEKNWCALFLEAEELPKDIVIRAKKHLDELKQEREIPISFVYEEFWKKEKTVTMNEGKNKTLEQFLHEDLPKEF